MQLSCRLCEGWFRYFLPRGCERQGFRRKASGDMEAFAVAGPGLLLLTSGPQRWPGWCSAPRLFPSGPQKAAADAGRLALTPTSPVSSSGPFCCLAGAPVPLNHVLPSLQSFPLGSWLQTTHRIQTASSGVRPPPRRVNTRYPRSLLINVALRSSVE